ncbi:hypothetical protein Pelo_16182 [Pelomyxa schiedti]|nr:hypothetical protein Pelo_16182 [Pelomyxa schiedti]
MWDEHCAKRLFRVLLTSRYKLTPTIHYVEFGLSAVLTGVTSASVETRVVRDFELWVDRARFICTVPGNDGKFPYLIKDTIGGTTKPVCTLDRLLPVISREEYAINERWWALFLSSAEFLVINLNDTRPAETATNIRMPDSSDWKSVLASRFCSWNPDHFVGRWIGTDLSLLRVIDLDQTQKTRSLEVVATTRAPFFICTALLFKKRNAPNVFIVKTSNEMCCSGLYEIQQDTSEVKLLRQFPSLCTFVLSQVSPTLFCVSFPVVMKHELWDVNTSAVLKELKVIDAISNTLTIDRKNTPLDVERVSSFL